MATIDFMGSTTNIGMGSDKKRNPSTGVNRPGMRTLNTGSGAAFLRGRDLGGRSRIDSPKSLYHSPIKTPVNDAIVKTLPLFTKAMADGVGIIEQATFDYKKRQDEADADQALLIARDLVSKAYLDIGEDGESKGFSTLKGQAAISGYDGYKNGVDSIFEKVGSGLNQNARASYEAKAHSYRTMAHNKGLKRRMSAEAERDADINFRKSDSFKRDLEGGFDDIVDQFRSGPPVYDTDGAVVPGKSAFEKSLPVNVSPEKRSIIQKEHYMFALDQILRDKPPEGFGTSLEAALAFNERHEQFNTPDGRREVDDYFKSKIKAHIDKEKETHVKNAKVVAASVLQDLPDMLGATIVTSSPQGFFNAIGQYQKLVQATESDTDDVNFSKRVGISIAEGLKGISEHEEGLGGGGIQLITDKWANFIQTANESGTPIPSKIKEVVRTELLNYRKELLEREKIKNEALEKNALLSIGVNEKGQLRLTDNQIKSLVPGDPDRQSRIIAAQKKMQKEFFSGVKKEQIDLREKNAARMMVQAIDGELLPGSPVMRHWLDMLVEGGISKSDFDKAQSKATSLVKHSQKMSPAEKTVRKDIESYVKSKFPLEKGESNEELIIERYNMEAQLDYDVANSKDPTNFDYKKWLKDYLQADQEQQEAKINEGYWDSIKSFFMNKDPILSTVNNAVELLKTPIPEETKDRFNKPIDIPFGSLLNKPQTYDLTKDERLSSSSAEQRKAAEFLRSKLGSRFNKLDEKQLKTLIDRLLKSPEYKEKESE